MPAQIEIDHLRHLREPREVGLEVRVVEAPGPAVQQHDGGPLAHSIAVGHERSTLDVEPQALVADLDLHTLILPIEHMFAFICQVQLALDALDRLVDTLEERGSLSAVEAARSLFATASISDGLACSLLEEVTAGDSRVVCAGATVSLVGGRVDPLLEEAEFVVFDLETTGLSAAAQPHLRDRSRPRAGARAGRLVRVAREPGRRPPAAGRATHRPARAGAAARTFRRRAFCGASSPSPATTCSSRTTPASTSASSSGSCS